jgi:hypothetical protein
MTDTTRWEYLTLDAYTDGKGGFQARLNSLGSHGWEAVGFAEVPDARNVEVRYPVIIMKRPAG